MQMGGVAASSEVKKHRKTPSYRFIQKTAQGEEENEERDDQRGNSPSVQEVQAVKPTGRYASVILIFNEPNGENEQDSTQHVDQENLPR